jgi:hypothetical protein
MPPYSWRRIPCQAQAKILDKPCSNIAICKYQHTFLCCIHGRSISKKLGIPLKKISDEDSRRQVIKKHKEYCDEQALELRKAGKAGCVTVCDKFKAGICETYINIYPIIKDARVIDGLVLSSLSSINIGPIHHGQPGLPPCMILQNFHEANRVYQDEIDGKGHPLPAFYERQIKMYSDTKQSECLSSSVYKNCVYYMWIDFTGKVERITEVMSRQFYCAFYQRSMIANSDFLRLKWMLMNGYNLRICGKEPFLIPLNKTMDDCYLNPSKPFTYEMILYTMLTYKDIDEYPWKKHKTFNF